MKPVSKRRAKGEGSIHQRPDGRWVGTVDLGWSAGKRVRKTYYARTKKAAQIKLATALRERDAHVLVAASPSMETWLTYWLDVICVDEGLKVNTLKSYRSKIGRYLIPHLGRHRVDKLQPEHVRAMYGAMREKGLAEATLRQTRAILRKALEDALKEGKATRNVATLVKPPKTVKKRRMPLSLADARTVLKDADLRWYVALYLGLRQGEALGLRWSDVNLDAGYLVIEQTLVRKPGVGLIFDTPKSEASKRLVPLPTVVLSRFKVAWAHHTADGGTADGLVFTDRGNPVDHRKDWQAWTDLLATAGVPHVALHAARNTAASLLEAAGVNDRMVAEILGHSSVQITHNYQQADLARRGEALRALEAYLAQPESPGLPRRRPTLPTANPASPPG